jgi:hypothetical protein
MVYEVHNGTVVFFEDEKLVFEAVLKDGHLKKRMNKNMKRPSPPTASI